MKVQHIFSLPEFRFIRILVTIQLRLSLIQNNSSFVASGIFFSAEWIGLPRKNKVVGPEKCPEQFNKLRFFQTSKIDGTIPGQCVKAGV